MSPWNLGYRVWKLTQASASCSWCLQNTMHSCAGHVQEPEWHYTGLVSAWFFAVLWDLCVGQVSRIRVGLPDLLYWHMIPWIREIDGCICEMCETIFGMFVNPHLSVALAKCCYLGSVISDGPSICIFSLNRNPDLDDRIYGYLRHLWLLSRQRMCVPCCCVGLNGHYP